MNISLALCKKQQLHTRTAVGNSTDFLAHKRTKEFTANLFTVEISGITAGGGRLEAFKLRYTGLSSDNTLDTGTKCTWGCTCMYIKRRTQFHLVFFGVECRSVSSPANRSRVFDVQLPDLVIWFGRWTWERVLYVYTLRCRGMYLVAGNDMSAKVQNCTCLRPRDMALHHLLRSHAKSRILWDRSLLSPPLQVGATPSVRKQREAFYNPPTAPWSNW